MKIINSTPNVLKDSLNSAIQDVVTDYKENYRINNPNFSRQRVLTMETVINLLFSMQGGSLKKELYDAGVSTTASTFVQQRDKIYKYGAQSQIRQLCNKQQVSILSGQDTIKRKRKVYYYEDVELTDELLVEYIDTETFTIYELEKIVGAKKNVLRGRYIRAKKQIQAQKCQNDKQ